jgi:hypothetical protein
MMPSERIGTPLERREKSLKSVKTRRAIVRAVRVAEGKAMRAERSEARLVEEAAGQGKINRVQERFF